MILIQLCEQGRDLALTEGVVKGVVDHLWRDPQPGSGNAVDDKRRLQTLRLLIGGDIPELRQRLAACRPAARSIGSTHSRRDLPACTDTAFG